MTNFHEIRLENALAFYNGKVVNIENTGDIPVYGSNGIIGFTDKSLFEDGIVIGRVGAYCGATIYEKGKFWGSDNTIIVEAKTGFDNQYLSYLLQVIDLNWFAGGSAQPLITHGWIKPIKAKIPDYFHQQKIAAILSAYDDLIENNLQRIKLLEEMAQITYEEWFVRMKFPGHEHTPIDSETGLPEGWQKKTCFEVMDVLSGGTPKTGISEFWNGTIKFFTPKDATSGIYTEETEKLVTDLGVKRCNSKLYPKDTLFITARGTVGKLNLASEPMAMNQSCYALKAKNGLSQYFLYCSLSKTIGAFKGAANGGVFDAIVVDTFKFLPFIKPPVLLVESFDRLVNPMFKCTSNILQQNNLLKEARDILLPRLMTGMIDIEQIELPETLLARIQMEASA